MTLSPSGGTGGTGGTSHHSVPPLGGAVPPQKNTEICPTTRGAWSVEANVPALINNLLSDVVLRAEAPPALPKCGTPLRGKRGK